MGSARRAREAAGGSRAGWRPAETSTSRRGKRAAALRSKRAAHSGSGDDRGQVVLEALCERLVRHVEVEIVVIGVLLAVMPVFFVRIVVMRRRGIVSVLVRSTWCTVAAGGSGRRNNNAHAHARS